MNVIQRLKPPQLSFDIKVQHLREQLRYHSWALGITLLACAIGQEQAMLTALEAARSIAKAAGSAQEGQPGLQLSH